MLRKSVCELYSNLVTRPTGAAVRCEIEQELDRIGDRALTIIDFSHVGLLDSRVPTRSSQNCCSST